MRYPRSVLALVLLSAGLGLRLAAAAPTAPPKPGYRVVLDVKFDENGTAEGADVYQSDDPTSDTILQRIAFHLAARMKEPPHLKDGKPEKFIARVPFDFPVDGDEGPEANNQPRPRQTGGTRPGYPDDLAAKGEVGGVVVELTVGTDGQVKNPHVLDASNPEFAASALASVKTWTFVPAMKDGKPVETRWRTAIAYSIDGKEVEYKWRVAPRPNLGGSIVGRAPAPAPNPNTPPALAPTAPPPLAPAAPGK